MDPVTALSVAAATVQFISFTGDVISKRRAIYHSADGGHVSQNELDTVAKSLRRLCSPLRNFDKQCGYMKDEQELSTLCKGCSEVTNSLEEALGKLQLKDNRHHRWKSFRQALKAVWSEEDIQQLSRRLDQYRSQIDTTMLFILRRTVDQLRSDQRTSSKDISKVLDSVSDDKRWQAEILASIQKQNWNQQDPASFREISQLLSASAELQRKEIIRADILRRLRFGCMDHRQERIPVAYQKTFEWAFHQSPCLDDEQTFDSYVHWLEEDEALYWITGKAGAGKSTLINHLFDDDRTEFFAKSWARSSDLVCAGFFCWNLGTELQMSREGLLRALLFQVLNRLRDTIASVFKESWENYELWGGDWTEWGWEDLVKIFKIMIADQRRSFLFFIDGLDEFSGNHTDLVDFILDISRRPNVKLCVASRPWLTFEKAFGKRPRLKVDTLMKGDIEYYISDKLEASKRFLDLQRNEPTDAKFLVSELRRKAEGVFLWVYLVVGSILEGLRDGDSMQELRSRIMSLPSDLEELFQRILSKLEIADFRQASMLFQLMDAVGQVPLTVLCVAFAEESLESAIKAPVKALSGSQRALKAETVRRKLYSRSKGLLEATPLAWKHDPECASIQYSHRTVKDFLTRKDIWEYIKSGTDESFIPSITLCSTSLLHLKTMSKAMCNIDGSWNDLALIELWFNVEGCFHHGSRAQQILAQNQVVACYDEMDQTITTLFERCSNRPKTANHWTDTSIEALSSESSRIAWVYSNPCSSFLEYAFYRGLHHYIETKVSSGAISVNHRLKGRTLLHRACQINNERMIRFLLMRGADPNMPASNDASLTPWQETLQQLDRSYHKDNLGWFWVVKLFIEHGADPRVFVYPSASPRVSEASRAYYILETSFGGQDFVSIKKLLGRGATTTNSFQGLETRSHVKEKEKKKTNNNKQ